MALNNSTVIEQNLTIKRNQKKSRQSLIWGSFNLVLFSVLLYDLINTCPLYISYVHYLEYALAVIFLLNILYHFSKYFFLSIKLEADKAIQTQSASAQKLDRSAVSTPKVGNIFTPIRMSINTPNVSLSATPMNVSALSWRSNLSDPRNNNVSQLSPYLNQTSSPSNVSPFKMQLTDISDVDVITDENSLTQYLKDYEKVQKMESIDNSVENTNNLLSSFWSHPASQNTKDASSYLKRNLYQIASHSPNSSSSSPNTKSDDKASPSQVQVQAIEMWKRLGVDTTSLTLWNENLRLWISKTILERLVKEFDHINGELQKHGFGDVSIGGVGLDRLRKTAQMLHISQHVPSLSAVIQFLEISTNQEYLVRRIRDLAKGGCMSDFKWNGGGNYNGKEWNYSLPTDSTIIMHLFATYLDTQLMPLPNNPDAKPFTSYHFVKFTDTLPPLTRNTLLIHQVSEKPPQYRVIVGEETFELQGYNNLFNSILFFLYHVNKKEHGMLGQVNLGKAGVNMLWIIQS